MSLGQWLNSLNAMGHGIVIGIFLLGLYFSYATLQGLIEFYHLKKKNKKFKIKLRITPAALIILGFIYSLLIYQILKAMFDFIP